jgi:predicted dehydrogenase
MGGMLYDLGAHLVDQAVLLMGPVVTVTASARALRGVSDDDVLLLLEHASGAVSMLVASQVGAFDGPRMTLFGTRGGLRIEASDSQEPVLVSGRTPADGAWGREPDSSAARLRTYTDASELTETSIPLEDGNWPAFYSGIVAALRDGVPAPVLVDDVIADLRVLDATRESARTGEPVRLDPPAGHRASSIG